MGDALKDRKETIEKTLVLDLAREMQKQAKRDKAA